MDGLEAAAEAATLERTGMLPKPNRWLPLREQLAQLIDQAKDGDAQALAELEYFKQIALALARQNKKLVAKAAPEPVVVTPPDPANVLPGSQKRVGVETRDRTLERLRWAFGEGCLSESEFDARAAAALAAVTQPELDRLVSDLDSPPAVVVAGSEPARRQTFGAAMLTANLIVWSVAAIITVLVFLGAAFAPATILGVLVGNAVSVAMYMAAVHEKKKRDVS